MKRFVLITLYTLLVLLIISCGGDTGGDAEEDSSQPTSPPVIQSFTASPTYATVGGTVTFSWSVTGADTISIDQGVGEVSSSGTTGVTMDTIGTINFTLTATNSAGTETAQVSIEVNDVSSETWAITFGDDFHDYGECIQKTSDNNFIVTGLIRWKPYSFDWQDDVLLMKIDHSGNILWDKKIGGWDDDSGYSVREILNNSSLKDATNSNGFIITGCTESYGAGWDDVYLVKTDSSGDDKWDKALHGTSSYDRGLEVQVTSDGNFIVVGYTQMSGSVSDEIYLAKVDPNGNKIWEKIFGGSKSDYAYSVQETSDGGFILTGATYSYGNGGETDVYLVKTDANGNKLWQKTFGGTDSDYGSCVRQISSSSTSVNSAETSGFIIAGFTKSLGAGKWDVYLIKTNNSGEKVWEKTFGGSEDEKAHCVQQTSDGGFIIVGMTESYGEGEEDIYLIKTDSSGNKEWEKTIGGSELDYGRWVLEISDGYMIAGNTMSFNAKKNDVFIIRTDKNGNVDLNSIMHIWNR